MVDIAGRSTEARKKPPLSAGRDRRQQNQPCFVPNSPPLLPLTKQRNANLHLAFCCHCCVRLVQSRVAIQMCSVVGCFVAQLRSN